MCQEFNNLIKSLNTQQKKAVFHKNGPAVVFAGAGSGKTRVIVARIVYLVTEQVEASKILAVTFTNKAAKEMRERLQVSSTVGHLVHVGTFHSACMRWLREFAGELGFSADFTIYDDKDSLQVLKKILKTFKLSSDLPPAKEYQRLIGQLKTYGLLPHESQAYAQSNPKSIIPFGIEVYELYQQELINCNAMDFSDLLLNMLLLLKKNKRVKNILQARYQHILIDEYQDTNGVQFSLIKELLEADNNLFVVGDDDQSIYSWRGANPNHIIKFKDYFTSAEEIRLEENYRSSACIVEAASAVIAKNKSRTYKKIWTQNARGSLIDYCFEYDGEAEAWWITDHIINEKSTIPLKDVAILYRTNAQSRQFEDILRKQKIPYQIHGSLRFYDRLEIKDIISYFRVMVNPDDNVALKRIINTPPRGIGKSSIEIIENSASEKQISMMEYLPQAIKDKKIRAAKKVEFFLELINDARKFLQKADLSELLPYLLKKVDYKEYISKKFIDNSQDKIANIFELGSALSEFSSSKKQANLSDWLREVSLFDNKSSDTTEGIHLMTMHASKGLEFDKVYISGFEDGLIPHINSLESEKEIEEERRILYVGMTRARKKLCLSSAAKRRLMNKWYVYKPSRFLEDIPRGIIKFQSDLTSSYLSESDIYLSEMKIIIGSFVYHQYFGKGEVVKTFSEYGCAKYVVDFDKLGPRKVTSEQLRLLNRG
jgi:DNA helicase II / ATP-dependent DNA helicase PcrA